MSYYGSDDLLNSVHYTESILKRNSEEIRLIETVIGPLVVMTYNEKDIFDADDFVSLIPEDEISTHMIHLTKL